VASADGRFKRQNRTSRTSYAVDIQKEQNFGAAYGVTAISE
jgi:hypothetical protein